MAAAFREAVEIVEREFETSAPTRKACETAYNAFLAGDLPFAIEILESIGFTKREARALCFALWRKAPFTRVAL